MGPCSRFGPGNRADSLSATEVNVWPSSRPRRYNCHIPMSKTASVEQRILQLREELNRHNHAYYVEARPTITDRQYDALMQELIELEKANPALMTADSPTKFGSASSLTDRVRS